MEFSLKYSIEGKQGISQFCRPESRIGMTVETDLAGGHGFFFENVISAPVG